MSLVEHLLSSAQELSIISLGLSKRLCWLREGFSECSVCVAHLFPRLLVQSLLLLLYSWINMFGFADAYDKTIKVSIIHDSIRPEDNSFLIVIADAFITYLDIFLIEEFFELDS